MGRPPLHPIRVTHRPIAVFFHTAFFVQSRRSRLSDAGYFYTGAVLYKQEPCLLQKQIFSRKSR